MLITSERHYAVLLAERMGRPVGVLLCEMSSSDWTQHRAAGLIQAAQQQIIANLSSRRQGQGAAPREFF